MQNKTIHELIADFLEYNATERERFIYRTMVGLDEIVYDDDYRYILNYPGGKVLTRQTFGKHREKLRWKIKGMTLHADPPRPAYSIK